MIFIDSRHKNGGKDPGAKYRCREHLSAQREQGIQTRELERGYAQGSLR
jgi:hypothetical protein